MIHTDTIWLKIALQRKELVKRLIDQTFLNQIYNRFVTTDKVDLTSDNPMITDLIKNFVKLRNNRTHSGEFLWDGSECLFDPLLALVYACFFMHSGADQELSYQLVKRLF